MLKTTGMIMPAEHKTSLKMENRAKSEKPFKSNMTELVVPVTYAQKKDIERTLADYSQFFNVDRGRALQLISSDADKELLNYRRAS